jgi:NAD(P)H-flavin reductase/hemoglobin-like flavoprotein
VPGSRKRQLPDQGRAVLLPRLRRRRQPKTAERLSSLLLRDRTCPLGPFPDEEPGPPETGWQAPSAETVRYPEAAAPPYEPPPLPLRVQAPPPVDTAVIRISIASVAADAQRCAGDFYGYLFAANPQLREMFPPVMGRQNERLFRALLKIAELLGTPDRLAAYLTQLGADHRKYGVRPEHYAMVGDALIRTLRRHSPAWDDRAEAAWLAAYAVAADAMIAGAETSPGPATWRGRVVRHQMLSDDLLVLGIQTDQPFPYEPGQYVTVMHRKWPRVWRQFSVASAPGPEFNYIELNVRYVPGGWVSTALARDTGVPDEVIIGPPVGSMTADVADGHDLLLVGGGVGLAPMKALAQDVLVRDESALAGGWGRRRNIALFHGARTPLDLYAMPELHELEKSFPWFSVVPVVSDDPEYTGEKGTVTDAVIRREWEGRHAYLAGPPQMISSTLDGLCSGGMSEEQVHYDDPGT